MTEAETIELVMQIRRSLHDLSQPLAAVTGLIDLLLLDIEEYDPRRKEIQVVSEQLEKVLQIISEIQQMAREASGLTPIIGKPAVHPEP